MRSLMRRGLAVLALLVAIVSPLAAQTTGFVSREFTDTDGQHAYQVYVPRSYSTDRKWPVILFLHGAGERGSDGKKQIEVGLGKILADRPDFPYLVVFPQCEDTTGRILTAWNAGTPDGQRALAILDDVLKDYAIDEGRQVLTGWSMGAYGAWSLSAASPDRWQAVVPLSGGITSDSQVDLAALRDVPVWAFQGATDEIVRPSETRSAVDSLRAAGGKPRYTEIKNVGHDIWRDVYAGDELWAWLKDPKADSSNVALKVKPGKRPLLEAGEEEAFVPALDVENAVFLRMGNDMLETLAHSVPARVPRSALTGGIRDIFDATVAEGRTFRVQFSRISYSAQVTRAYAKAYAPGRLNIQLGIQNAVLNIGTTYVTGQDHSAVAGPIQVGIGHRGPVWLSIAVEPYVSDRKLRLRLVATRFDIPQNNWYVTSPAGVSTRGFGMTRERVASGLVSGLYGSRRRIENEVQSIVPNLLAELEKNLDLSELGSTAALFWPLPVYKPRLQVWPQDVSTDESGMSLVFGVTAAAVDPQTPPAQRIQAAAGTRKASELDRTEALEVGISARSLKPLSQLLIDADVARVHVEDIPDGAFAAFVDARRLQQIFPDLEARSDQLEVWSELVMLEPLDVTDAAPQESVERSESESTGTDPADADSPGTTNLNAAESEAELPAAPGTPSDAVRDEPASSKRPGSGQMNFHVPRVAISIAIRRTGESQWTPYAEAEFDVQQQASIDVARPDYETRLLRLEWVGEPVIRATARFAPTATPDDDSIDRAALEQLFRECWSHWTGTGPARETAVADIDFGNSIMRLEDLGWDAGSLYARFQPPGIRITNLSDEPLVYEVRSETSRWGGPYRIAPGESDNYNVGYPLNFRRRVGSTYQQYTLPVGSQSEFREPRAGGSLQLFRTAKGQQVSEQDDPASAASGEADVSPR